MHAYDNNLAAGTQRSRADGLYRGGCNARLMLNDKEMSFDQMLEMLRSIPSEKRGDYLVEFFELIRDAPEAKRVLLHFLQLAIIKV